MIIESKQGPSPVVSPNSTDSASQRAAKDRAISILMGANQAPQGETPDVNQNKLAPEEVSAIRNSDRQNNTIETSSERPEAETKAPEEPLSSQYAVLARKEKALRLKDQQLRQREAALKSSESPSKPQQPSFDESKYISKDKLLSDPFGELHQIGLDYEKLTEKVLNGPTSDQIKQADYIKKLEARLESLEGKATKALQTVEERDNSARLAALRQIRNDVAGVVSEPEYEAIRATNSINDVVELIERTFDEDGVLLTVEDAAQQVESYLVDEALKFAKLKKIQQKLQAPSEPKQDSQNQQRQMKTLTNSVGSTRPLSAKERAILAFKGQLKS